MNALIVSLVVFGLYVPLVVTILYPYWAFSRDGGEGMLNITMLTIGLVTGVIVVFAIRVLLK